MNQTPTSSTLRHWVTATIQQATTLRTFFAGLLIPCGFAPIHMPGLAILGIALLFAQLNQKNRGRVDHSSSEGLRPTTCSRDREILLNAQHDCTEIDRAGSREHVAGRRDSNAQQILKKSFQTGFVFGLGYFGLGISWLYVSIHNYGHLNAPLSAFITFLFVSYLALFPGLVAMLYQRLAVKSSLIFNCFLFSAVWCLGEFLRATFLTGFPWLLLGVGQFDTPLKYLLPIMGVFGVSFFTCLAATCLAASVQATREKRSPWIIACVVILIAPLLLKNHEWTKTHSPDISVGVIQANISMRDKWDEQLFWQILEKYEHEAVQLIGKKQLIIMPESAIPVPINYVSDFLNELDRRAKQGGSAILFGIPEPTSTDDTAYYNTLASVGTAQGSYLKQHLVPFGEFIPKVFQQLSTLLALPAANLKSGANQQSLVTVQHHPIASLICYEVAYPELLRSQLPKAEWIVSISDDGWFGHSLAVYQQLQMSQVLSMQTGRFQIVANNDGLSSVINAQGDVVDSLPVFSSGILNASIRSATGASPWVYLGDMPVLLISLIVVFMGFLFLFRQSRKP